ncbi:MAG TPA: glutamate--tRNA ligase [Patescibacteria group bacterium]|nr:glutamate--tRNA ligase [Patescibacteria group bacterium]
MEQEKIITRFAPSPTGELHIGGARTALFAYLFTKHAGGEFLLRIEDTDRARFVAGSDKRIIESLRWLGLVPDNLDHVIYQSERAESYKKFAFDLIRAGHAYICTCSKEELEENRKEQEKSSRPPHYSRTCRNASFDLSDLKEGCYVVRMKLPESGAIVVDDLIRGKVAFDLSLLDDQVILKSDGYPTYHLASVVDDHDMGITHVIRAEEWLSSTPKHLILYKMLGWEPPKFAHMPMVLAPDRTKLSKRHGATSVEEFKSLGYLPDAIINFIALLGWNPKDEREIFTLSELISEFKLANLNKAPAIFNIEKLNSINAHYIIEQIRNPKSHSSLSLRAHPSESMTEIRNKFQNFNLPNIQNGELELIGRGGYRTLKEAAEYILKLRQEPKYDAQLLIFKKSDKEKTAQALKLVSSKLVSLEPSSAKATEGKQWNNEAIQQLLTAIVENNNLTNGDVFWPVRVALSGEEKSPSPVELAIALGKEETFRRIAKAISELN